MVWQPLQMMIFLIFGGGLSLIFLSRLSRGYYRFDIYAAVFLGGSALWAGLCLALGLMRGREGCGGEGNALLARVEGLWGYSFQGQREGLWQALAGEAGGAALAGPAAGDGGPWVLLGVFGVYLLGCAWMDSQTTWVCNVWHGLGLAALGGWLVIYGNGSAWIYWIFWLGAQWFLFRPWYGLADVYVFSLSGCLLLAMGHGLESCLRHMLWAWLFLVIKLLAARFLGLLGKSFSTLRRQLLSSGRRWRWAQDRALSGEGEGNPFIPYIYAGFWVEIAIIAWFYT